MEPLTKIGLDIAAAAGCGNPNCKHKHDDTIFLQAGCHRGSAVEVMYVKGEGILRVFCAECKRPIINVKVADQ